MPLTRTLMRTGLRKGLFEGNRAWLVVGAVAGGIRLLRRVARREPEILLSEELPDGAVMVIANKGTPARR